MNVQNITEKRALRSKFFDEASSILETYNIPSDIFLPKAIVDDGEEKYIKLYPAELARKSNFYIELVTTDYEPILSSNGNRQIRFWKFNPHYAEEYKKMTLSMVEIYLVPIIELVIINPEKSSSQPKLQTKGITTLETVKGKSLNTDAPFNTMSIRDFVAILHKTPVSHKSWLNDLINKIND